MKQIKYLGSCLSLRLQPLLTKELFGCQFRRPILLNPNWYQNRLPISPPAAFLGFEVSLAAHLLSFDALGLHQFCQFETGRPNSGMRSDSLSCSRSMSAIVRIWSKFGESNSKYLLAASRQIETHTSDSPESKFKLQIQSFGSSSFGCSVPQCHQSEFRFWWQTVWPD